MQEDGGRFQLFVTGMARSKGGLERALVQGWRHEAASTIDESRPEKGALDGQDAD